MANVRQKPPVIEAWTIKEIAEKGIPVEIQMMAYFHKDGTMRLETSLGWFTGNVTSYLVHWISTTNTWEIMAKDYFEKYYEIIPETST